MTEKEKKAKKQSLEQQIALLHEESIKEARILTKIYEEKKEAMDSMKEFEKEKAQRLLELEKVENKLRAEKETINQERELLKRGEELFQEEIKRLKEERKRLEKDLGKINMLVLEARDEYAEFTNKSVILEENIKSKEVYLSDLEILQESISKLSNEKNLLLEKNAEIKEEHSKHLLEYHKKLIELSNKAESLMESADKAEYRLKKFNDEYVKKERDQRITISRIEEHYKKAFPGLKLNI